MTEETLQTIFATHTGKQSDKWDSYLHLYEDLLAPWRARELTLLEIGIQNGGSLEVWATYFSRARQIIGCDINPDCRALQFGDPRITTVIGDASSASVAAQLRELSNGFDIVIDDGSHTSGDIIRAFCHYFPMLRPGGMFIAEDLHCSYWQDYEGGLYDPLSAQSFFKQLTDIANRDHWGINIDRQSFMDPFTRHFEVQCPFEDIYSVSFYDSVCVVTKTPSEAGGLGLRRLSGQEARVVATLETARDQALQAPDQSDNPLSQPEAAANSDQHLRTRLMDLKKQQNNTNRKADHLQAENARLLADNEALHKQLDKLHASLSWRIGAPVRRALSLAALSASKFSALRELSRQQGGLRKTAPQALALLRREGLPGLLSRLNNPNPLGQRYREWLALYPETDGQQASSTRDQRGPLISVLMPVYRPELEALRAAIESIRSQHYPHWELCIADDASQDPQLKTLLEDYQARDERIKVAVRERNGHISAASNTALELCTGEFVALLDQDDLLAPQALLRVAQLVVEQPDLRLIYSDEDKITPRGKRFDPYFKPDFNLTLFMAQNLISHLGVYHRQTIADLGGFREGYEGSQDYDLALRTIAAIGPDRVAHIPEVLYHWRAAPGSTALSLNEKSYARNAGLRALQDWLDTRGGGEAHFAADSPTFYRVRFPAPPAETRVSIIITSRDRPDLLDRCIRSLREQSTWCNYEIIVVDNGSTTRATVDLLDSLAADGIQVLHDGGDFNFSRLNNKAARRARGEVLCLLSDDTEVLTPDWMEQMLGFVTQDRVGCVGARLWYPDGTLQHGGIILGADGIAGHAHAGLSRAQPGYCGRALLHQEFSAVTGACLMVRKSVYEALGGLDESLPVAFNDVDFCLRAGQRGLVTVWTPYAELTYHESATRDPDLEDARRQHFQQEITTMQSRWGHALSCDPAYSPKLNLKRADFDLAYPPRPC